MRNQIKQSLILAVVAICLSSCGKKVTMESENEPAETYSLQGQAYQVRKGGTLNHLSSLISGTGGIVFLEKLGGVLASNNVSVTAVLKNGAGVRILAFGSADLAGAPSVLVTRQGNNLSFELADKTGETVTSAVRGFPDGDIPISVDFHNSEGHVLVWLGGDVNPVLNANGGNVCRGGGSYWGLDLSDAKIKGAQVSEPRLKH